jgi:hypothetical protein
VGREKWSEKKSGNLCSNGGFAFWVELNLPWSPSAPWLLTDLARLLLTSPRSSIKPRKKKLTTETSVNRQVERKNMTAHENKSGRKLLREQAKRDNQKDVQPRKTTGEQSLFKKLQEAEVSLHCGNRDEKR